MVVVSCLVSWISTMREPKKQNRNSAGGLSSHVRGPWEQGASLPHWGWL